MDYKRHRVLLAIRLIIILAVMMTIPVVTMYTGSNRMIFTYVVIIVVLIFLVIELWSFLNRTVRELNRFLSHVKNRDFNLKFNEEEIGKSRRDLYKTFNEVMQTLRDIRIEREAQFRFLEHIMELIDVGIIVFDEQGKVVLINSAGEHMTATSAPANREHILRKNPGLRSALESISSSGRILEESIRPDIHQHLAIQIITTRVLDHPYVILTLQDVRSVVEQKETLAWIRLMRVLNHEIKNSFTPVTSLADTILMILEAEGGKHKPLEKVTNENLEDIVSSVRTIQKRGNELQSFIDAYHSLIRIPVPQPVLVSCRDLLKDSAELITSMTAPAGIQLSIQQPARDHIVRVDPGLIRQVLINLVSNAMDALSDAYKPEITIFCRPVKSALKLCVKDNGTGIDEALMEEVFVPFFTTKPGGSGIGLSLSRQIMRLHGGNITLASKKGEGTTICLEIPEF